MTFDKVKYNNAFNKEHYARLSVMIPIENRPNIDNHWKSKGFKSFNAYITELIRRDMNEENESKSNMHIENLNQNANTINMG